jgi:hypothetical protein
MELDIMNKTYRTVGDRDNRLGNFAAELTSADYPLVLRHGLKTSWLSVELGLWRALETTLEKWARKLPPELARAFAGQAAAVTAEERRVI